ncbi:ABC transporter permease, partial [Candidatus Latescibacterota bacterium]
GFEVFVAKRYLLKKKKTGFISIISVISIVGITIGVAALIIVLSLMNGFSKELRSRLVGMDGHIWVNKPFEGGISNYGDVVTKLKNIPGVNGVSPYCNYSTVGIDLDMSNPVHVMIRGVDIGTVDSVSDVRNYIRNSGNLNFREDENGVPGVVLGSYLARALGFSDIGDYIFIYGLSDINTVLETMTPPPLSKFRVTGIFESGFFDYDNSVMLISISEAQKIIGYDDNKVSGIVLKLADIFKANEFTAPDGVIDQALGGYPYSSLSWMEQNQVLFRWMKMEKWAAFIVLSLIIIVAAFNIVSSLIMLVMDKTREIGILKSMGASNKSIERIFVYQGAFVGVCGTLAGSVIGTLLCYIQDKYQLISFPGEIYFISSLPMDLEMGDTLTITLVTLFLCWLSSFYPAKKAAELDPVEAIRSE